MKKTNLKKTKFLYYTQKRKNNSGELFLCELLYTDLINAFWKNIFQKHTDRVFLLQIRFKSEDMWRSLSNIERVTYDEKDVCTDMIIDKFSLFESTYSQIPVEKLFVRYLMLPKDAPKSQLKKVEQKVKNMYFQPLDQNNLPTDINLSAWGNILSESESLVVIERGKFMVTVSIQDKTREVSVFGNNKLVTSFTDTIISEKSFTRTLNGQTLAYGDGCVTQTVYKQDEGLFIRKAPKVKELKFNIIALDLETRNLKDKGLEVISAAYFDGVNSKTFFLLDYDNSADMLKDMLFSLLNNKENDHKIVYVHNLSGFDAIFLLKSFVENSD